MTETKRPTDFILAGASIFAEKRDRNPEPSLKALALRGLLEAAFTGIAPSEKDIAVLREGRHTPTAEPWTRALTEQVQQPRAKHSPRRGLRARRAGWVGEKRQQCDAKHKELPLMEGFQLPSDAEAAEKYCDALIERGVDPYVVWQNVQTTFARRG